MILIWCAGNYNLKKNLSNTVKSTMNTCYQNDKHEIVICPKTVILSYCEKNLRKLKLIIEAVEHMN